MINWKLFWVLLIACVIGNVAVLPYAWSLIGIGDSVKLPVPIPVAMLAQVVQGGVLFGAAIIVGLHLGEKVHLGAPVLQRWVDRQPLADAIRRRAIIASILGIVVGVAIVVLDRYVFGIFVEPITPIQSTPAWWRRVLACLYGGVNEEVLLRLFLVTLVVWLWWRIGGKRAEGPSNAAIWTAIIVSSIIFGLGHLPMTAKFMVIDAAVVVRAVVLNGIAGIAFGWLYWKKGLLASMISHFVTDVVLFIVAPAVAP